MSLEQWKQRAFALLEKRAGNIVALGESLFSCPELGFREERTGEIIAGELARLEIPHTRGVALTGIKATLGSAGYHIALMADIDAVLVGDRTVHSCGHSIQAAVMLGVMGILKEAGFCDRRHGRVSFIAAPAEEFIDLEYRKALIREGKIRCPSGKQNMILDGVFDDIDCVIQIHASGDADYAFDVNTSLAGFRTKKAIFRGMAAHSGAAPHLGRNAFHGAVLTMNALALLQEQFPCEAGVHIHPVFSGGPMSMNVIPELAALETYVRAGQTEWLFTATEKFDRCAKNCAAALGLDCDIETGAGYLPLKQSAELCAAALRNMLPICGERLIARDRKSGASGDIGDISFLLPSVQLGFSGTAGRIHTLDFSIADPHHVYIDTAQVVLGMILDIMGDTALQVRNPHFCSDRDRYLQEWLGV
ncbi:MAG: peptidase dimerization domain-containing protein [Treponema sp.]|jgi:amidohydrolase|nr:peptidase dimerization domain-containing protein [Treponema sp.]